MKCEADGYGVCSANCDGAEAHWEVDANKDGTIWLDVCKGQARDAEAQGFAVRRKISNDPLPLFD